MSSSGCGPSLAGEHIMSWDPSDVLLRTERLVLRRFRSSDAQLLFDLDSDPEVMRFITKGQATPLAQIEHEILPRVLGYYARTPPQGVWAAHLQSQNEFIGWFHLRADKIQPQEMELGYRLRRSAWGCGLATEGSRGLLKKGFEEWQFEKICARTLVGNVASRRVMEKIGMQFETEFSYGSDVLPGWALEERRGLKYALTRQRYLEQLQRGPKPPG